MLLVLTIPHQIIAGIPNFFDCTYVSDLIGVLYVPVAFTISPSSQVVGVGQVAVFRCQYSNVPLIFWRVNETRVTFNSPHPNPGITIGTTMDENNNVVNLLSILAQSEYNETVIVCEAKFLVGSPNETTPVKLLIQGEPATDGVYLYNQKSLRTIKFVSLVVYLDLSSCLNLICLRVGPLSVVTEIKRNSSIITWVAPFSLDLTGVDPDIINCVEVYNITCGVDDLVVGDCDVTEQRFVDNRLQQGYVYRITIIPRSNGQGAQNGTSNTMKGTSSSIIFSEILCIHVTLHAI
jgi:hypothetical protein